MDTFILQVSAIAATPVFEVGSLAGFWDAFCPAAGIPLGFARVFPQSSIHYSYLGPLGYGWLHNYDIHLEEFSDGNIALLMGNSYSHFFLSNGDGTYTPLRDYGTLTRNPDDTFQLREKDGTTYHFRTDLRLDYIEDTNGNRISAVYNPDNLLIELQHSCGESFSLQYNEHWRISRLIDHAGRATEYQYDASGELLLSVTTPDGVVTGYGYTSGGLNHGLSSISYPEGIQQFFEYNDDGRLSKVYLDGGEELTRLSYDVANQVTYITDADGNTTTIHIDEFGQVAWLENQLVKLPDPVGIGQLGVLQYGGRLFLVVLRFFVILIILHGLLLSTYERPPFHTFPRLKCGIFQDSTCGMTHLAKSVERASSTPHPYPSAAVGSCQLAVL